MNSRYHLFRYWSKYGSNPLATYFASEYKNIEDAEAALLGSINGRSIKNYYLTIIDLLSDTWYYLIRFFSRDFEKESMEKYFSEAVDHKDLERRIQNWNRGVPRIKFYI